MLFRRRLHPDELAARGAAAGLEHASSLVPGRGNIGVTKRVTFVA
jgi:hypothetical protein